MEKMFVSSCFLVFLMVVSAQTERECLTKKEEHGRDEYPDPMDIRYVGYTGRGGKLSHIADPDCVMTMEQSDLLDNLIERIENATVCPCAAHYCPEDDPRGYRIGVALMYKMKPDENLQKPMKSDVNKELANGRLFAYTLEQRWEWGHCSEDIVIFYSMEDNVLYTMTGKQTAVRLRPEVVGEISMNWREFFTKGWRQHYGKGQTIFKGLEGMISDFRDVLMNNYTSKLNMNEIPRTGAVVGDEGSSAEHISLSMIVMVASVMMGFFTII